MINFSYWKWLFTGIGGRPGILKYFDIWFLVHLTVGFTIALIIPVGLNEVACKALLPMAGIFVGLSFSWGGNAQALLQTSEISRLTSYHPNGFLEYVYTYQSAILLILITLILWGIASLSIFDLFWPTKEQPYAYLGVSVLLFSSSSIALRDCWHVVLGSQWMLIIRHHINQSEKND